MGYTVKYLNDKEFDMLPFRDVKEALGCADKKTQTAWVRRTGIKAIDMFVTDHEIEELVNKYSDHEVEGIRYKKYGNLAAGIGTAILSRIHPLLGAVAGGGYEGYKESRGEGISGNQAWGIPVEMIAGALGGMGKGGAAAAGLLNATATGIHTHDPMQAATSGVTTGLGDYGVGQATGGAMAGFGSAAGKGLGSELWGAAKGAIGMGGSGAAGVGTAAVPMGVNLSGASSGAGAGATSGIGWGVNGAGVGAGAAPASAGFGFGINPSLTGGLANNQYTGANYGVGGGGLPTTGVSGNAGDATSNAGFGSGIPTTGVGGGATNNVAANFMKNPSVVPPASATTSQNGVSGLFNGASKMLSSSWGQTALGTAIPLIGGAFAPKAKPLNPMDSAQYADLLNRVKSGTMAQLTPEQQKNITSNYDQQLAVATDNLKRQWAASRPGSDISNDSEFQYMNQQMQSQYAQAKAAALTQAQMGLTTEQTQNLMQLAQLDVYSLAQAAGISAQEAADFKSMLSSMGTMVASGGKNSAISQLSAMFNK